MTTTTKKITVVTLPYVTTATIPPINLSVLPTTSDFETTTESTTSTPENFIYFTTTEDANQEFEDIFETTITVRNNMVVTIV